MAELKIKNIDGKVRWQFWAEFIYFFQMNPPDCQRAAWGLDIARESLAEATTEFWIQFKNEHDISMVKDFKLTIESFPCNETTITTKD